MRGLCATLAAGWGGQWEPKRRGPPNVVEFGVQGERRVIKWGIPPTAGLLGPKTGWPLSQWDCEGMGKDERGHLGLFLHLTARSKDRFVKNYPEGSGHRWEGSRRGTWSPHNQNDGERQWQGRGAWGGGARELFPPEPTGFSVSYARGSGGKSPNNALFSQYFSFLGTSQGKLSLPKWP